MELLLFRGITVELPRNYSLSTKNYHEMNERGIFYSKNSIYEVVSYKVCKRKRYSEIF